MVWWSRLPRTGSGTFSDAIAKAIDGSWQKHSEHDASVSFRWDVGPTICAKAANWHQPWFMEAHIPHPEPYHQPACAALKNGNHRPFVFGEMREPAKWCWSWIAFWWRHRTHPHAPLWAKRYYAPLRSAPDFNIFAQRHASEACELQMTRWFCGAACAPRASEMVPANISQARRREMRARAVCAVKYVYAAVGELEDAIGLLRRVQAREPSLFDKPVAMPKQDAHVRSSTTPPKPLTERVIAEATADDADFYAATRRFMGVRMRALAAEMGEAHQIET